MMLAVMRIMRFLEVGRVFGMRAAMHATRFLQQEHVSAYVGSYVLCDPLSRSLHLTCVVLRAPHAEADSRHV